MKKEETTANTRNMSHRERRRNAEYTNSEIPNLISPFVILIFSNSRISVSVGASMCVCSGVQSCPSFCDPMDYSLPGSFVLGISQARIVEGVATSFFRGFSWCRDQIRVSL